LQVVLDYFGRTLYFKNGSTMAGKTRKITVQKQTRYIQIAKKVCPQCGKTFERALHAKYCSNRCVNNASYARHAEEIRAKQRAKYAAKKNKP
jgi:endogenous inhibitor of DNA gyrase (YacG/DUF329 family)